MNHKKLDHLVDFDRIDILEKKYHDEIKDLIYQNMEGECSHGCDWKIHWEESIKGTLQPYHTNMFTWKVTIEETQEYIFFNEIFDCIKVNLPRGGIEVHYRFEMPFKDIGFEGIHNDPNKKYWLGFSPTKQLYTCEELVGPEDSDDLKLVLDSRFLWWDETFLHASNYGSHGISISFTGDEEV